EYYEQVTENEALSDEVRAHAAMLAVPLLEDRLDGEAARAMALRAAELDPYNIPALQQAHAILIAGEASRAERVESLAKMLRANPVQPALMAAIADELAAAGLADQALRLSRTSLQTYASLGVAQPTELLTQYGALLLLTDRPDQALSELQATRELADVVSVDQLYLTALSADRLGDTQSIEVIERHYRWLIRLAESQLIEGVEPPEEPSPLGGGEADLPLPDLVRLSTAAQEQAATREPGDLPLDQLLGDYALLQLLLLEQAAQPEVLEAIDRVSAEGAPIPPRLAGLQAWRDGDVRTAREKLSAVSAGDPLAAVFDMLVRREGGEDVAAEAQDLLGEYPAGLMGATIAHFFRDEGVIVRPVAQANAVRDALDIFPQRLLGLLDPGRVKDFYSVTTSPRSVRHTFGEPLIADVTIRNTSGEVLTVGPGGTLDPVVRADAKLAGFANERVPNTGTARIYDVTRLEPGERAETTIRVDGPELTAFFASNPHLPVAMFSDLATNPIVVPIPDEDGVMQAGFGIGPAGQTAAFRRVMERVGEPLSLDDEDIALKMQAQLSNLRDGQPLQRVRAAQLTAAQINWLLRHIQNLEDRGNVEPEEIDAWKTQGVRMQQQLVRAGNTVRPGGENASADAIVRFLAATVAVTDDRVPMIEPLLQSPDWRQRAAGVLAATTVIGDAETSTRLITPLINDEDATVARLAESTVQAMRLIQSRNAEAEAAGEAAE
ncbi:MAG: hypothetical protein AAGK78_00590, partial [Planctomycetota bacterium]